jgi:hypothetical protein
VIEGVPGISDVERARPKAVQEVLASTRDQRDGRLNSGVPHDPNVFGGELIRCGDAQRFAWIGLASVGCGRSLPLLSYVGGCSTD